MSFTDVGKKNKNSNSEEKISFWQTIIAGVFTIFMITLPFVFTWVNEELFEVPKMLWTYIFTIILVACWCLRMITEKRFIFKRTFLDLPILLFLIVQIISTLLSMHPRTSLLGYYTRLNGGLLSTIAYCLIYFVITSNLNFKQLKKISLWVLYGAIFSSLYAILEHFGHSTSCLLITKKFDVACWVQDVQARVFGTFGQPNWLAAYNLTLIPLGATYLCTNLLQKRQKVFITISLITMFTALLFTGSRSGLLAALAGLAIVFVGFFIIKLRKKNKRSPLTWKTFQPVIMITIALAIIALIFGTRYTPSINELINRGHITKTVAEKKIMPVEETASVEEITRYDEGGTDSGEIRKIVWDGAIDVWKRYPIFGSGPETFAYSYYLDRPMKHNLVSEWDFLYNKAHNEFLNYLATTGLVGLLTYLIIFIVFAIKIIIFIWDKEKDSDQKLILVGLLGGTIGLSLSNFFGFSTVACQVLQFFFFALAALIISKPQPSQEARKINDFVWWQFILIFVTLVINILLIVRVIDYWSADIHYARGKSQVTKGKSSEGLASIEKAISLNPNEALYYNDLSDFYAQLAIAYHKAQQPELATQALLTSLEHLAKTVELNSAHLNFYKTRTRTYLTLSQMDSSYLELAKENLLASMTLAPTDPKLVYNYALLLSALGEDEASEQELRRALEMRPIYHEIRHSLAQLEEERGNYAEALQHYQYVLDYITLNDTIAITGVARLATMSGVITEGSHE